MRSILRFDLRRLLVLSVACFATALAVGCSGSSNSGNSTPAPISVSLTPTTATLTAGQTQTFTATVANDGTATPGVTWAASAGTITSSGLYTAPASIPTNTTATVTATSKTDTSKTATATVTLQAPAALSISTTSLPNANTSVAYSQTLTATGGTAPYTWTITSGGLPGTLALSSGGVISGTPANNITVTATFTVKVTDNASNSTTKVLTLVSGPALSAGANNSELNGTYGLLVQGMYNGNSPSSNGKVYGETIIGSIAMNGAGLVTSGSLDNYDARNNSSSTTVTGNYTLGSDNRGTLILNSGTRSFTFAIAAAGISSGTASRLKLVQFEDNNSSAPGLAIATGYGKIQTSSAFTQLNGTYVFGMSGETACTTCATGVTPFGSVAIAGYFAASAGNIASGTADAHAFNASYNGLTLSGSTVAPAAGTGRGTITLSVVGTNFPTMPTHFVYYVLNANELLIASTDAHNATSSASGMLAGSMQLQTISSYGASTLGGGNIIAYQQYENGGNGTTSYSQYSGAIILEVQLTANSNAFSAIADENDGNNAAPLLNQSFTGLTYNLSTGGRLTVSGAGSGTPILYFSGVGTGYGVDQSVGGDGGLYTMAKQTGGPFSLATGAGTTLAMVSLPPASVTQGSFTGILNLSSPGGTASLTQDYVQAGSLTAGVTGTSPYALDAGTVATTGRGSVTSGAIIYFVNANKLVAIDSTASGAPNVTLIENNTATSLPF